MFHFPLQRFGAGQVEYSGLYHSSVPETIPEAVNRVDEDSEIEPYSKSAVKRGQKAPELGVTGFIR